MILDFYEDIKKTLLEMLSYETVLSQPTDGAPFGTENAKCLQRFLQIANELGFETVNADNYAGHADFGEGEIYSLLCHLDVVPAGNGWTVPPYMATFLDGKILGRGIIDNKGPAVAILYCLAALKKEGIIPKRKFRLIVGCNEENGGKCMEYYKTKCPLSEEGFSPDADFPVIYAEKGVLHMDCKFELENADLTEISGGVRVNMVADYCKAVYNGNLYEFHGKSAHGSHPENGENAIVATLAELGKFDKQLAKIAHKLGDCNGNNCNLAMADVISGCLTLNVGTVSLENGILNLGVDIRYPICGIKENILNTLKKELQCEINLFNEHASHYVDASLPHVQTLLGCYNKEMKTQAKPLTIGGATYARQLKKGVAFGPEFPGQVTNLHSADEFVTEELYKKMLKIYYSALYELAIKA